MKDSIHVATLTHNYPSAGVVAIIDPAKPLADQLLRMIIADGYDPDNQRYQAEIVQVFGADPLPAHIVCWWLGVYRGGSTDVQVNRAAAEALIGGWNPEGVGVLNLMVESGDGLLLQTMRPGEVALLPEPTD